VVGLDKPNPFGRGYLVLGEDVQSIAAPNDQLAVRLRGFGPLGLLAILVILLADVVVKPLSAVLVLVWTWRSHTPWREIGYVRPKTWIGSLAIGVLFGVALKLFMKAVVMPLLGADPVNQAYHFLVGNLAAVPGILYTMIVGAGFGEETLFRGYMFERLGKLFSTGPSTRVFIVLFTSILFGLAHYSTQGIAGAEQALITGVVFGTTFAVTGQLWMLMCAHAAYDLTAVAIIYWNVEAGVAHFIFS
jgi:membrane protease YdiL (CAAX protease family)